MRGTLVFFAALLVVFTINAKLCTTLEENEAQDNSKAGRLARLLPLFQVVTFPNNGCMGTGSTRNGTCYTAEECETRGGTNSGTCAQGFGVCCIISLGCGQSSSENCTYLVHSATSTTTPCNYKICKSSPDVCRIRLDFTTFSIADPFVGTTLTGSVDSGGGAIGDCLTDTFTYTSPGNTGSPTICGFNTGQHMILDASELCNEVSFNFGSSSSTTRQYDIKVTQYECGTNLGGEPDCLQYHTGTSGSIASFNMPLTTTTVDAAKTHLSSQCYSICFRRESGMCGLCFSPKITNVIGIDGAQSSFGLSKSGSGTIAQSIVTACSEDYVTIPGAQLVSPTIALSMTGRASVVARICGRVFSAINANTLAIAYAAIAHESICTVNRPFKIDFKTDDNELSVSAAGTDATNQEQHDPPGGIVGFLLNYAQVSC